MMAMNRWFAEARVKQRNELRVKRRIAGRFPSHRNKMSKKTVSVEEEQEEEWEVTQIVAKRVRDDGVVEVILQYAQKWQVVDDCIADGPLYKKFLVDEAEEAVKSTADASVASVGAEPRVDAVREEDSETVEKKDAKKEVKKDAKEDAKKVKVDRPRRTCTK